MKKIFIILAITYISNFTFAQNPNLGTAGAQFLQIPVGARSESMGGAIVGLANDASAVFWNPAGIVKVENVQVHFTNMNWFDLFDFNAASIVYNTGDFGTIAANMLIFSTGDMEITTEEKPNGTGRYFDAEDISFGISYAKYLTDRFSVGLSTKYINQRIWNESASGIAFDIGTQYTLDFKNLTIAMCMKNFGADMKLDGPDLGFTYLKDENYPFSRLVPGSLSTQGYPMPLNFQVGIGFEVLKYDFIEINGAIDVSHLNDNNERAHFGTEVSLFDRLFMRAGYKYNYDVQDYTFGAGANVPFGDTNINFDYSYSLYNILPNVHSISINLSY